MGRGGDSITEIFNSSFGAVSSGSNFSNLFGGGNTFNMGAGSSSYTFNSDSMDLSSIMKNDNTAKGGDGGGMGTIEADVAASVGVGVGGGSGSAGSVDKTTANTTTDTMSRVTSAGGGYALPLAIGGVGLVTLLLLFKKGKK